jgi:hypothetical protein
MTWAWWQTELPFKFPTELRCTVAAESSKTIAQFRFKYMNGAGELYLGYRFDHLEIFEYSCEILILRYSPLPCICYV